MIVSLSTPQIALLRALVDEKVEALLEGADRLRKCEVEITYNPIQDLLADAATDCTPGSHGAARALSNALFPKEREPKPALPQATETVPEPAQEPVMPETPHPKPRPAKIDILDMVKEAGGEIARGDLYRAVGTSGPAFRKQLDVLIHAGKVTETVDRHKKRAVVRIVKAVDSAMAKITGAPNGVKGIELPKGSPARQHPEVFMR